MRVDTVFTSAVHRRYILLLRSSDAQFMIIKTADNSLTSMARGWLF